MRIILLFECNLLYIIFLSGGWNMKFNCFVAVRSIFYWIFEIFRIVWRFVVFLSWHSVDISIEVWFLLAPILSNYFGCDFIWNWGGKVAFSRIPINFGLLKFNELFQILSKLCEQILYFFDKFYKISYLKSKFQKNSLFILKFQ